MNLCWHLTTKSEVLVDMSVLMLGFNFKAVRLVGLRFRWSFGFWVVSGEDRDCRRNISSSSSTLLSTLYSLLSSRLCFPFLFFQFGFFGERERERRVWKWNRFGLEEFKSYGAYCRKLLKGGNDMRLMERSNNRDATFVKEISFEAEAFTYESEFW